MAATIVRVKRRLQDDPVEALLLSFKRKKSDLTTSTQALMKYAATVDKKDDIASAKSIICKSKEELKETYKSHTPDIHGRQRRETENHRKQSRFKILSLNRSINFEASSSSFENVSPVTIVDVDTEVDDQVLPTHEPKYVYDLYSTDMFKDDADDGYLESLYSVQPFTSQLQYRESEDSDEIDPCDEDSNDEDYYKNDYPDSEQSVTEDDMRLVDMLHRVGIDTGVELSSDTEDELITSLDSSTQPRSYEAYKKRILREWREEEEVVSKNESIGDEYDREISVHSESSGDEGVYS